MDFRSPQQNYVVSLVHTYFDFNLRHFNLLRSPFFQIVSYFVQVVHDVFIVRGDGVTYPLSLAYSTATPYIRHFRIYNANQS